MNLNWQLLYQFIKQHQLEQRDLVVGLSGGVDSIVLLHLFMQLRENTQINFSAVHVNHGLSQFAEKWQQQIQNLCEQQQVTLTVKQVQIPTKSRTSLEQQARDARYQAISEAVKPNGILFTGHHQSDQMETFLLRLMRGSGLTGLSSMRAVSNYPHKAGQEKQLKIARPLLSINKQHIIELAQSHELTWVEDDSNNDDSFDRNFVRLSILPKLFNRWPMAGKSITTSTQLLQQDIDLLNEYVEQDYLACVDKGFNNHLVLNIERLTGLSVTKQKAVVRMFVHQQISVYPALTTLNELLQQIANINSDSNIQLKVSDNVLKTHKNHLYLIGSNVINQRDLTTVEVMVSNGQWCVLPENTLYQEIKVDIGAEIGNGSELGNRSESELSQLNDAQLKIKWARFSDMFQPNKNSGHKKLNKYLKEAGCPTWWRAQLPLVYINNHIVAVAGIAVSATFPNKVTVELK